MANKLILDSCALLAYVYNEAGADVIESALKQADEGSAALYMNKLNLPEAYYDIMRSRGLQQAEVLYSMVLMSPIHIVDVISDPAFREAGRIKTQYRISLADSIVLGEASVLGAAILTCDHHEFDLVERGENIKFTWIR